MGEDRSEWLLAAHKRPPAGGRPSKQWGSDEVTTQGGFPDAHTLLLFGAMMAPLAKVASGAVTLGGSGLSTCLAGTSGLTARLVTDSLLSVQVLL